MRKLRPAEAVVLALRAQESKARCEKALESVRTAASEYLNSEPPNEGILSTRLQDLVSMIRLHRSHPTELNDFVQLLIGMQARCESMMMEPDFFEDGSGELQMTWTDSRRTAEISWRAEGWLIQGTERFGPIANVREMRVPRSDLDSVMGAMLWAIKEIPWPGLN